ncbi:MAG: serine/threonine protein kinase [Tissierellia bacterium]|nr:serine/threonine protein kinase [Tissierellia bacterium]MDD4779975.1 serine/threonine protein kinase [Tissierellia bacterium]
MDNIKLIIPKKSEYISTIRLTTSSLSNIDGFDIDEIEDLKVIVSEVCIFFINNVVSNEKPLEIDYLIENDIFKIEVTDLNDGEFIVNNGINNEMCVLIIKSLSDKYKIDIENKKISFEKKFINIE